MTDYSQLPEWTCHKVVRAGKIVGYDLAGRADGPQNTIQLVVLAADGSRVELDVPYEVSARKAPAFGDYLVVYDKGPDGEPYVSWSPAAVFEDGYSLGRRATFPPLDEQTPLGPGVPRSRAPNEAVKFINEVIDECMEHAGLLQPEQPPTISPRPTVGRIVHYQLGSAVVPMLIADVIVDFEKSRLLISGPFFAKGWPVNKAWAEYVAEGTEPGTWRWPERVG